MTLYGAEDRGAQVNAKVPEPLKEDFRDACDDLDRSMTDVIVEQMGEFVEVHSPDHTIQESTGYYPSNPHHRELYDACLTAAERDLKLYQRRHAAIVAQETQQVSKDELADALMPLRRTGYVAQGAMPIDLAGEAAKRWRHWHIKPPEADPGEWKYSEVNR